MTLRTLLLAAAAILLPTAHAADTPLRVVVRDVYANGLAVGTSEMFQHKLVIADFPRDRVSLDATYPSADALYAALARQLKGTVTEVDGVRILRPGCAPAVAEAAALPLSNRPISLSFNRVRAGTLLGILADVNGLPLADQAPSQNEPAMGVRFKDATSASVYAAVSRATGAVLVKQGGAYVIRQSAAFAACAGDARGPDEPVGPPPRRCPRVNGQESPCEPLETHDLAELVPRGFVAVNGTTSVLLEGTNRLTYFASTGDYLGFHHGKVLSVDERGVVVREMRKDASGLWVEVRTHIGFDNQREVLSSRPL